MIISIVAALSAIYFALYIYTRKISVAAKFSSIFKSLYNLLLNKYYVDEIYETVVVQPIQKGSEKILWKFFDVSIIDGAVNGIAKLIDKFSGTARKIQTGIVQSYAIVMLVGIAIVLFWIIMNL